MLIFIFTYSLPALNNVYSGSLLIPLLGKQNIEFERLKPNTSQVRLRGLINCDGFIYNDEKMRLGAKRNALNAEAKGNIIIAMDDDDYYPPDRVQTVVDVFNKNPRIDLVGSSAMLLYYTDLKKIYMLGPFNKNHATNGTMAWSKRYSDTHIYDEYVTKAVEKSFLDNYKNEMIQLDPLKTILVICHSDNTVDKYVLREEHFKATTHLHLKETNFQLDEIVKDLNVRNFYLNL